MPPSDPEVSTTARQVVDEKLTSEIVDVWLALQQEEDALMEQAKALDEAFSELGRKKAAFRTERELTGLTFAQITLVMAAFDKGRK